MDCRRHRSDASVSHYRRANRNGSTPRSKPRIKAICGDRKTAARSWALISKDGTSTAGPGYFSRFGVSPDNADEVYFLTQSLTRSIDGGATLKPIRKSIPTSTTSGSTRRMATA